MQCHFLALSLQSKSYFLDVYYLAILKNLSPLLGLEFNPGIGLRRIVWLLSQFHESASAHDVVFSNPFFPGRRIRLNFDHGRVDLIGDPKTREGHGPSRRSGGFVIESPTIIPIENEFVPAGSPPNHESNLPRSRLLGSP